MTDELDRIRALRDDAPDPSTDWVHRTRAELLDMAAEEPTQDEVVQASSCRGGEGAYTVRHPVGWHTNKGDVIDACQRFDDEPVELEDQTGGAAEQPVVVRVLPVPFEIASEPGWAMEEQSRTDATVADRPAVVVERTSTGQAGLPEGLRTYQYLVDLGGDAP